ncbi:hypothetical protein [Streptomyces chattanoogensis]|uniref:hypothetical protein n=1 Tax=Streptomyces chattanoogensis TaxID=66876 RepID=UPI0036AB39EF
MLTHLAKGDSRLSFWLRVREFAVPPSMIETATTRRSAGDWAGACAAAGIDVDLNLRAVACTHGQELAAQVRADLRHLAPDLLRWHLPRVAPDGLLRPGLTLSLARYDAVGPNGAGPVHLVVRTPPAWADAGQRISLALWDGSRSEAGACRHPHPRPDRRFRLDLHRHLWDARRAEELRFRSGADRLPADGRSAPDPELPEPKLPDLKLPDPELLKSVPEERRCAVDRWAAEAGILLRAERQHEGRPTGAVTVRLGGRHRLVLDLVADEDGTAPPAIRSALPSTDGGVSALPVLPDAATWVLPDLELIRTGAIQAERLHPLVASALVPDCSPAGPSRTPDLAGQPRLVECRGAQHRIGPVNGVLAPLDHDPAEIRREELLAALTGTPLPCLQAIDEAHRHPHCLDDVRERLAHGDTAGALAVVEGLLGPDALLRDGALRDELAAAAQRRITYGLFRAGLVGPGPARFRPDRRRTRDRRSHPRHTTSR